MIPAAATAPAESPPPPGTPESEVADRLLAIETLLGRGTPEALGEVDLEVTALQALLEQAPLRDSPHVRTLRAAVLTAKGHAGRLTGQLTLAVSAYDEALRIFELAPDGSVRDRQCANLWTCRGLALLSTQDPGRLEEAVESFDRAISLRTGREASRSDRWGLAAACLNRADALAALGGADRLLAAIVSTRQAREALADFDPEENASFRTRWALSWMKEGEFTAKLFHHYGSGDGQRAIELHTQAITVLRPGAEMGLEESRRILSAALSNLSRTRLLLDGSGSSSGEAEARESLTWIGDAETSSPELISLGATARITLACHLEAMNEGEESQMEITDLTEAGLTIGAKARCEWGPGALDERLLGELTRLGAEAYLRTAPQFLVDFLLDLLDPTRNEWHLAEVADVHEAAVRTLWKGIAAIKGEGFSDLGGERFAARQDLLASWEHCRETLAEIRRAYFEI